MRATCKERYVLMHRYGLDCQESATLAELAEELGVTRERVRQVQERAQHTLKLKCRKGVLRKAVG